MKNINTGNDFKIFETGDDRNFLKTFVEVTKTDRSWVYCSMDSNYEFYAQLEEGLKIIALVKGYPCIDDALLALEDAIDELKQSGDDRSILDWSAPQTLGI